MRSIFITLLFLLFGATNTLAYELTVTEVDQPYDIVPIEHDEFNKEVHLGALNGFPLMYEFSSERPFELSFRLSEVERGSGSTGFSLLFVRQNDEDGGVTEIARQMANDNTWTARKDSAYGLTFIEGEVKTLDLEPGTYRVEVSTPVNEGRYMLTVGSESDPLGYFETLSRTRAIQKHYGYSIVKMLTSSYVYYPLGIILMLFILHRTWKYRKSISYVG